MTPHVKAFSLLCLTLLTLSACKPSPSGSSSQPVPSPTATSSHNLTYKDYTAVLTPISFDDLAQKMAKRDKFVLFIGKESCAACNQFVPKLHQVITQTGTTVYYFDAETASDQNIQAFRDKFGITSTPNLSYYHGDQKINTLEQGSQASLEEIEALVQLGQH